MIEEKIRRVIRDVPDFPKPGILFKDITPLLHDPALSREITQQLAERVKHLHIDAVVGVESRGFLYGFRVAELLNVPFVLVRKSGKLPYKTIGTEYALEYGTAKVEMHTDALQPGWNVLIHDDLLATGGTAGAAARLVEMQQAKVAAFEFIVELDFLGGRKPLEGFGAEIISLVTYGLE